MFRHSLLAVVLLTFVAPISAQDPKLPFVPAATEAWTKAGGKPAVMITDGEYATFATTYLGDARAQKGFGFLFENWAPGQFKDLPDPGAPFSLGLSETAATDAMITELASQNNLRLLMLLGPKVKITDDGLKQMASFKGLQELYIQAESLTDDGLKALAKSTSLERIHILSGKKLTATGIEQLVNIKNLHTLEFNNTKLTLEALTSLSKVKNLRVLSLNNTTLGKDDSKILQSFPALERLSFNGPEVSDDTIRHIAKIDRIKELNFRVSPIHDESLKALSAMPNLTHLNVHGCQISDDGMVHIKNFPKLTHLVIGDRPFTNKTLKELAKATNLKWLHIYRPAMTKSGLRDFWTSRPDLTGWVDN